MRMDTKKITALAMITAVAFILAAFVRVPVVLFLRYDPKDVVIAIAGFIYGPGAALLVSVIVSTIQMFTVSQTGPIGWVMNVIASVAFCCTAAYIYKKNRTLKGAVYGLIAGLFLATSAMMLWNYLIAPIFMATGEMTVREARELIVVPLLLPAFLPFNLISNGLNAAFTILLYKHVKRALQAANMLPPADDSQVPVQSAKINTGAIVVAAFVVVSCILWVLVLQGVI